MAHGRATLMTRRTFIAGSLGFAGLLGLAGCSSGAGATPAASPSSPAAGGDGGAGAAAAGNAADGTPAGAGPREVEGFSFQEGSQTDRGFVVNDALETPEGRTLHFSLHVPDAYDGSAPFALYVACPGWEGLYFQGVGANLQEDYPFVANDYVPDMIVATPQLDDWGEQSAADAVALTEWLLAAFNIDPARVYLSGCSGGGETISIVLGTQPRLYRRALQVISRWDGDIDTLAGAQVPVYLAIGEADDYYGAEPAREAYARICDAYRARDVSEDRIAELVTLDVKPISYFEERGWPASRGQHAGGGALFAHDEQIMGWLFR